jgi:hypothetical protein
MRPGRLAAVYLIATEAHAPTGGDAVARVDLEAEAIRRSGRFHPRWSGDQLPRCHAASVDDSSRKGCSEHLTDKTGGIEY